MLQFDLLHTPGITYRELQPEEFHKLQDHEALKKVGVPASDCARILIAEREDGTIVGFLMAIQVIHLEPVWVHPQYRGTMVLIRLWKTATRLLDALRVPIVYCFSESPTISGYLTRLGLKKLPYETFLYDPQDRYPK